MGLAEGTKERGMNDEDNEWETQTGLQHMHVLVGASVGGGTPQQCSLFCLQFDPCNSVWRGSRRTSSKCIDELHDGPAAPLKCQIWDWENQAPPPELRLMLDAPPARLRPLALPANFMDLLTAHLCVVQRT